MLQRKKLSPQVLPASISAVTGVTGKGKMTEHGYQAENHEWSPWLTKPDGGKRVGRDPKLIEHKVLVAAGHPPKSATNRMLHYYKDLQMERPAGARGLKFLRQLCLTCSNDSPAEVRRCPCIDCPLWAHRLGTNPHNFHKRQAKRQ